SEPPYAESGFGSDTGLDGKAWRRVAICFGRRTEGGAAISAGLPKGWRLSYARRQLQAFVRRPANRGAGGVLDRPLRARPRAALGGTPSDCSLGSRQNRRPSESLPGLVQMDLLSQARRDRLRQMLRRGLRTRVGRYRR